MRDGLRGSPAAKLWGPSRKITTAPFRVGPSVHRSSRFRESSRRRRTQARIEAATLGVGGLAGEKRTRLDASSCCKARNGRPALYKGMGQGKLRARLYADSETGVPLKRSLRRSGGNPTALAELRAGETVLDLGSGGGIDVCVANC